MNKLSSIIGLAPSELSLEAFHAKLSLERQRVRESLEEFRRRSKFPKIRVAKSKTVKVSTSLNPLLAALEISPEQLLKGLALLRAQKTLGIKT